MLKAERPSRSPTPPRCPENGEQGYGVEWRTVAAVTMGPIPLRREYWRCGAPDCEIIYFAEDGHTLRATDLRFVAGSKSTSLDAVLCFCFLHCRRDFLLAPRQGREHALFSRIATEVKAGNCACEVRNPTGRCCLGEIKQEIAQSAS